MCICKVVKTMPVVYLKQELYDELVLQKINPDEYVNDAVIEKLSREPDEFFTQGAIKKLKELGFDLGEPK